MRFLSATVLFASACAGAGAQPAPIPIGVARSFFVDQEKTLAEIATEDFKVVMKKVTELDGAIDSKQDALAVAEGLDKKTLGFGFLHAHELGWALKKFPALEPLLIVRTKQAEERAYVIVHKKAEMKSLRELAGKKFDIPVGTKEPSRLFLQKLCAEAGDKTPQTLFGTLEKSKARQEALDQIARRKVDATIVDAQTLEFYKEIKAPVYEKNLAILAVSEVFPPAVLVYKKGNLPEATVTQFRDGLLKAHTAAEGKELMKSWSMTAFETPPAGFLQSIESIVKNYPAPK